MPACPNCSNETNKVVKEWNYGVFHVKNMQCNKCNKSFKAYYRKGRLTHIINNNVRNLGKIRYEQQRKIMRYLSMHEVAGTEEIATALGFSSEDVLAVLEKLEKKGKILCSNSSTEK